MFKWDDYWTNFIASKAENWIVTERHKIISKYADQLSGSTIRIMEVGCGYGSNIRLLNNSRKDVECHALDKSTVSTNIVSKEIPLTHTTDCRTTNLESDYFDLIFSSGLMEHFEDELPFINEMKRILRIGGYLITFVPAKISLWQIYLLFRKINPPFGHEKSYTSKKLLNLFNHGEFSIVDFVGLDPFSINSVLMKIFNSTINPVLNKSILQNGYHEIGIIVKKI